MLLASRGAPLCHGGVPEGAGAAQLPLSNAPAGQGQLMEGDTAWGAAPGAHITRSGPSTKPCSSGDPAFGAELGLLD